MIKKMYFDIDVFEYCAQIIVIIQVFFTMKIHQWNLLTKSLVTQTITFFIDESHQ